MSDRTKQVQFRMPSRLHKELKLALIENDSSFADFFNRAAEWYLEQYSGKSENLMGKEVAKEEAH